HHGAAAVVEAVAKGGRGRRVIDGEGTDAHAFVVVHRERLARGRWADLARHRIRSSGRHRLCAVMRDAIERVEEIGLSKAVDDFGDPGRAVNGNRPAMAGDPTLHYSFAQLADMV